MHILFLTHYFHPEGNAPATRVYELARRWVKAGCRVTVLTGVPNVPSGVAYPGYRNRLRQCETLEGIEVVRVWTYLAANKGTLRRTLNYLSFMSMACWAGRSVGTPDVVIATSPQFFCGWAGAHVAEILGKPFILEIRDLWPESIRAVGAITRPGLIRGLENLERKLYARADHIVTVGEGYRRRLVERHVPGERISVVPNGVDLSTFHWREPDPQLKRAYGLEKVFVCSYIGTIGMAAGLNVILRAAQILKERDNHAIRFLLVGDGAAREDLQEQACEQGLSNVIFTGLQDKQRIPAFLSISDVCLVHLRKAELFETVMPSKIYEAAAMARPIILGVQGEAAKLVNETGAGICIEPENPHQLADALAALTSDVHRVQEMGRNGAERLAPRFDMDTLAAGYLRTITDVCRRGSSAS